MLKPSAVRQRTSVTVVSLDRGDGKRRNLAAAEVAKTVRDDLVNRQFLATADFSPDPRLQDEDACAEHCHMIMHLPSGDL